VSGKKSFGGTFTFSNCHIIGLDTVGLVFLVSELAHTKVKNGLSMFLVLYFKRRQ
jgi:hypothetical protein